MKQNIAIYKFPEQVAVAFEFLQEYGFVGVASSLVKVRYESDKVYLEILFGELDGEVSITFGRIGKNEEFSFTLFLRLVSPALEKQIGERLVEHPNQVHDCLAKLSAALLSEGKDILRGEDRIFDRMKEVRWWDFQPEALKENPEKP